MNDFHFQDRENSPENQHLPQVKNEDDQLPSIRELNSPTHHIHSIFSTLDDLESLWLRFWMFLGPWSHVHSQFFWLHSESYRLEFCIHDHSRHTPMSEEEDPPRWWTRTTTWQLRFTSDSPWSSDSINSRFRKIPARNQEMVSQTVYTNAPWSQSDDSTTDVFSTTNHGSFP